MNYVFVNQPITTWTTERRFVEFPRKRKIAQRTKGKRKSARLVRELIHQMRVECEARILSMWLRG